MPKENDETKAEGTENEETEEDETSSTTSTENDETEEELEAEVEAGASETVPRAEMLKAIRARQAAKKKARELQQKLDEMARQNETESETKAREAAEAVTKTLTQKYKPALIKTAAEAALLAAKPKKGKAGIPRLIKLMDLDEIEVTDDLELEGVEEEVTRLQEEFPELFGEEPTGDDNEDKKTTVPRQRRATSKSQDGAGKKPAEKKLSTSEIILKKLKGEEV